MTFVSFIKIIDTSEIGNIEGYTVALPMMQHDSVISEIIIFVSFIYMYLYCCHIGVVTSDCTIFECDSYWEYLGIYSNAAAFDDLRAKVSLRH